MTPPLKLLALDTATDACSVALHVDGAIAQRHEIAPQRHTQLVLPMVRALCAEAGIGLAQLDAIAVGIGPGAFTGVRVATAIAQGLAYAHDLPVLAISTLAALAQGGYRLTGIRTQLATLDARRHELYWACYEADAEGIVRAVDAERVTAATALALPAAAAWRAVGTGWLGYAPAMRDAWPELGPLPLLYPEAQDVATLGVAELRAGRAIAAAALAPTYLRAPV
ncbi:MAG TPA: tRNA (adenosine(37)-N6)-threonylcarbamoyltransferase complex dimerization subunit type 1 TsaB [Gammaproteobacteria bacterium]|nr:tRNA (adenosine(37)-N6)-threonylcarbamoyltransferase complex dimerization subunit type 1 TsaB [Gammaproteobacteria bacterium]